MATEPTEERSDKPFGDVVDDALYKQRTERLRPKSLLSFWKEMKKLHGWTKGYDSLRKQVTGEDPPQPDAMEAVAKALGISPRSFREYQVWEAKSIVEDAINDGRLSLETLLTLVEESRIENETEEAWNAEETP